MADTCIHEVSRCTICTPLVEPWMARSFGRGTSSMFVACYEGRCGICDFDVREGDEVRYVEGQLCHVRCADTDGDAA
jgi:hypothetical protein